MKLDYLHVIIEPWHHMDTGDQVLKIKVVANNKQFHLEKVIWPDDFETFFDRTMDIAKEVIKKTIKEHGENNDTH